MGWLRHCMYSIRFLCANCNKGLNLTRDSAMGKLIATLVDYWLFNQQHQLISTAFVGMFWQPSKKHCSEQYSINHEQFTPDKMTKYSLVAAMNQKRYYIISLPYFDTQWQWWNLSNLPPTNKPQKSTNSCNFCACVNEDWVSSLLTNLNEISERSS